MLLQILAFCIPLASAVEDVVKESLRSDDECLEGQCALNAVQLQRALRSSPSCPPFPEPYAPPMDCGRHVQQCGVLAIDTGLGFYGGLNGSKCANSSSPTGCTDQTNPPYNQPRAKVHGLWFETPPYGNSSCLHSHDWDTACQNQSWVFAPEAYCKEQACDSAGIPQCYSVKKLPTCYQGYRGPFAAGAQGELERRYMLWFVNHEWQKHGTCGQQDPTDYFAQVCRLSGPLVRAIDSYRMQGLDNYTDVHAIACKLSKDFDYVEISSTGGSTFGTNGEILLSACLNLATGQWHVAPVSQFERLCGDPAYVRPML